MMDVSTSKPVGSWEPTTMEWGTIAYEETRMRFADLMANVRQPRSQAFALWALSHDQFLDGDRLLSFGGSCGDDRPTPDQIDEALNALGLPARPKGSPSPKSSSRGTRKSGARKSELLVQMKKLNQLLP